MDKPLSKANKSNLSVSTRRQDKARLIALALHHAGFRVGYGVIGDATMPRIIRPYPTVKA